jgi:bisanhydrobacterioruberin hydratase
MNETRRDNAPFIYIGIITIVSVFLILVNVMLGMIIPFKVDFLVGFVFTLMIFVVWHAILTKGWKRSLLMFVLSYIIAFIAEVLGVNFGLIFGSYHYTPMLGIQPLGVPLLAALAWEPIIYASFMMTNILIPFLPEQTTPWKKILFSYIGLSIMGAVATTAWDLMIDPIAVGHGWWVWHDGGAYVSNIGGGVPVTNFLGWLLVAFIINLVYRYLNNSAIKTNQSPSLIIYGPLTLYSSLFLTSFGISISNLGHPEVALVGMMAMGPFILLALYPILIPKKGV